MLLSENILYLFQTAIFVNVSITLSIKCELIRSIETFTEITRCLSKAN